MGDFHTFWVRMEDGTVLVIMSNETQLSVRKWKQKHYQV